ANDRKMMKIQYLNGIGENDEFQPIEINQPISEEAADHIVDLMVNTVNKEYGTAQEYSVPGVQIAAKTGTAQIANPDGLGYLEGANDYYFSVVSFFPAEDPTYMLYFSIIRLHNDHNLMGSQILDEIFIHYLEYVSVYE